ncbi:MAG: carboxypeptidase-like regulatory domain-containing protein [Candidatus Rokuibacteriota bacterium]
MLDQREDTGETIPDAPPEPAPPSGRFRPFQTPLSRVRTIVGLTAGIVSITGALVSFTGYFRPNGQLITIVRDRSGAAVSGAVVEVLTPQKAILTTLAADARGRARLPIEPGSYVLRVNHPRLGSEMRAVEIRSGLTAEVRMSLRGHPPAPAGSTAKGGPTGSATAAGPAGAAAPGPGSAAVAASPPSEPRVATPPARPARGAGQAP